MYALRCLLAITSEPGASEIVQIPHVHTHTTSFWQLSMQATLAKSFDIGMVW